jgi:DNA repair exonuclease SbcCD ATPase subunit
MLNRIKKRLFPKQSEHMEVLTQDINHTFSQVSKDISHLRHWIMYVHSKHEKNHSTHKGHIEITKKEIENMSKWIEHLKDENNKLKKFMGEISKYLVEFNKGYKIMDERIKELEKRTQGQERTEEILKKGHIEDMRKDIQGQFRGHISLERTRQVKIIDKNALTASQAELIHLLYKSEEPLDYARIAHILRKKEKSIRNLIYEIREKGIKILDCPIGFRKKGFYLNAEEKLKVSGR